MSATAADSSAIDFFISYTGKDQAWAEWIAWQLEHAGYSTVIQAWDFKSGGVFPGDMHRALQQSTRVIAVLTPDYMGSKFCAPEWQAAFKRDPTGEKGILVCVRVTAFDPGGLLAGRTYIDLVGRAPDAARDFLLRRLKPDRAKPAIAPPHPGTAPAFPGAVPASADFVIPQNLPGGYIGRLFVGRDDFLVRLRKTLLHQSAGHATAITQSAPAATSLNGLGGIGKTHTAVEYAAKYRGDYTALLFVHGDSPARLQASLAFLCGVLQLDVDDGQPEPQRADAAVGWLASHRGWLLIVDNVDDEAAVAALTRLLSHLTTGHVLITTRLQDWENNVEALDLDVLNPEAAADFLCAAADHRFGNRASDPLDVRTWPRWNPLAVHAQALATHAPDQPAPEGLSWLLGKLDCLLDTKGLPYEAAKYSRRALGIDEASFGKDHPNVARDLNNLAQLLKATNRLAEAEPLMRRALEIFSASYGPEHPSSQTVQRNLAALM